jgi:hypothetical protein
MSMKVNDDDDADPWSLWKWDLRVSRRSWAMISFEPAVADADADAGMAMRLL